MLDRSLVIVSRDGILHERDARLDGAGAAPGTFKNRLGFVEARHRAERMTEHEPGPRIVRAQRAQPARRRFGAGRITSGQADDRHRLPGGRERRIDLHGRLQFGQRVGEASGAQQYAPKLFMGLGPPRVPRDQLAGELFGSFDIVLLQQPAHLLQVLLERHFFLGRAHRDRE